MKYSRIVGFSAAIAILVSLDVLSMLQMFAEIDSLRHYKESRDVCESLKTKIERLREREAIASALPVSNQASSSQMIQAARAVGVQNKHIAGFQHLPPVKIENSPYTREDLVVQLHRLDMTQLISLTLDLERGDPPLVVTSAAMRPAEGIPGAGIGPELWNAELVLSRLAVTLSSP